MLDRFTGYKRLLALAALNGGASIIERTAIGNPLTFLTDLARPLKSLLIPFTPQQEGTGDPSPTNVRPIVPWNGLTVFSGGKNLFDKTQGRDGFVWWEGRELAGYDDYRTSGKIPVVPGGKYTLKKDAMGQNQIMYFSKSGEYIRQDTGTLGNLISTFTVPENVYFIAFNVQIAVLDTAQLEAGQTATAYEPYEPITETDIVFPAMGKNLLDPSRRTASGNNVQYYRTGNRFLLKGGQTYTVSANVIPAQISIFKGTNTPVVTTTSATLTYTPTENVEVWFDFYIPNARLPEGGISAVYGQLELGDTAHSYEPFTNAVYGGTLDVVSGVLTVESVKALIKDFEWSYNDAYGYMQSFSIVDVVKKATSASTPIDGLVCDSYTNRSAAAAGSGAVNNTVAVGLYGELRIRDNNYSDASTFVTAMGESVIVYPLATPQEIQLTPQQITALLGDNTIWSDANGQMTAVYLKKG